MEQILEILQQVEKTKQVRILFACETGSRAWGFPSPDSDYDVRFLYCHEKDWYLQLGQPKDSIEIMVDDLWDLSGWGLKKSLLLLKKSNTSLIERFQSPIKYYSDDVFLADCMPLVKTYYSPVAVFFHHYSLAKNFWNDLQTQQAVKLKSYCYLLRSLLSCNWIIASEEVPPMHIEGLMQLADEGVREYLRQLIQFKATVGEQYLHPRDKFLDEWIESMWAKANAAKNSLPAANTNLDALNTLFLKTIR